MPEHFCWLTNGSDRPSFLTSFRSPVTCPFPPPAPMDPAMMLASPWVGGIEAPVQSSSFESDWGGTWNYERRAAAFLLTISTSAAPIVLACATIAAAAKVAAALLKPPISEFLMFGQKESAHRSAAGETLITVVVGRSASKFDGLIKDDHNWGGRSKEQKLSWRYAQSVCLTHSCPAIAEWAMGEIAIWVWLFFRSSSPFLWKNAIDG